MAELLQVIQERRSFRGLKEDAIPDDVLGRIMTAATYAPSCSNNQPWRYLVIKGGNALERARGHLAGGNYWARKAPVLILVITRNDLDCQIGSREYADFDTGMSAMSLQLQAWHEGCYAHPMAGFKAKGMTEEFGIDAEGHRLITVIALGYMGSADELSDKHKELEHSERDRKPLSDVVCYDEWKAPDPAPDKEG